MSYIYIYIYIYMEYPFLMFLDHTQRCSTVGRTPLDEWSARRRDLYLTTHDTHNRQISMPSVGFEPKISAGERPQAAHLLSAATVCKNFYFLFMWSSTCFGRHTAHHQGPKTALAASGFAYVEGCWTSNNPPPMQSQRLLVQFYSPDDGQCFARKMLSFT